ncbi:MAG: hypothetical protein WA885_10625 [Phormidesmis sp.]
MKQITESGGLKKMHFRFRGLLGGYTARWGSSVYLLNNGLINVQRDRLHNLPAKQLTHSAINKIRRSVNAKVINLHYHRINYIE